MKMLTTIVRPEKLDAVQTVLQPQEASLICVSEVRSYCAEPSQKNVYRGAPYEVRPAKLRLEIIVEDIYLDEVVGEIAKAAAGPGPARAGDGAIFVTSLEECIRIGRNDRVHASLGA